MARTRRSLVEEAFSDLMQMRIDITKLAMGDSAPTLEVVNEFSERLGENTEALMRAMNRAKRALEFGVEDTDVHPQI